MLAGRLDLSSHHRQMPSGLPSRCHCDVSKRPDVPVLPLDIDQTVMKTRPFWKLADKEKMESMNSNSLDLVACDTTASAVQATASAQITANIAREQLASLSDYMEERRAEAERQRLASAQRADDWQRGCLELGLVEQAHWSVSSNDDPGTPTPKARHCALPRTPTACTKASNRGQRIKRVRSGKWHVKCAQQVSPGVELGFLT